MPDRGGGERTVYRGRESLGLLVLLALGLDLLLAVGTANLVADLLGHAAVVPAPAPGALHLSLDLTLCHADNITGKIGLSRKEDTKKAALGPFRGRLTVTARARD